MSVKPPVNLGCNQWVFPYRILYRMYQEGSIVPCNRRREPTSPVISPRRDIKTGYCNSFNKWKFVLDIERAKDEEKVAKMSLPTMIYLYSPWVMLTTQYNLWMLRLLWDWRFTESQFVDSSKQALVLISRFIVDQQEGYIKRCCTPLGFKQIKNNIISAAGDQSKLLDFDARHIRRAFLLKVQRMEHYGHKFAFIDMIFLVCRRSNDFLSKKQKDRMGQLICQYADITKIFVPNPVVFAEVFVRFRRDYSLPPSVRAGHWLISNYKVLGLDVLNFYPDFHVGGDVHDLRNPLSQTSF